jgi:hypothetical protein
VGGVRKWQFLLIYSTIYADVILEWSQTNSSLFFYQAMPPGLFLGFIKTRYVSRVVKYNKKSFHHLTVFFMGIAIICIQEIEISWWLFELPAR